VNGSAVLRTERGMTPRFRAAALALSCAALFACAPNVPARSGSSVATEQTPTERYETYRSTLARAWSLDQLLPLTSRAVRDETDKRPESFRKALLADLQARKVAHLRVVEERVDGDHATLMVDAVTVIDPATKTRGPGRATVRLVRENGVWCVDEEVWTIEGKDGSGITPSGW